MDFLNGSGQTVTFALDAEQTGLAAATTVLCLVHWHGGIQEGSGPFPADHAFDVAPGGGVLVLATDEGRGC